MNKYQNCEVTVWEENPLTTETKYGGIILVCHENRIVYDNTLEKRVHIAKDLMIPEVRAKMFPNIKPIESPDN